MRKLLMGLVLVVGMLVAGPGCRGVVMNAEFRGVAGNAVVYSDGALARWDTLDANQRKDVCTTLSSVLHAVVDEADGKAVK